MQGRGVLEWDLSGGAGGWHGTSAVHGLDGIRYVAVKPQGCSTARGGGGVCAASVLGGWLWGDLRQIDDSTSQTGNIWSVEVAAIKHTHTLCSGGVSRWTFEGGEKLSAGRKWAINHSIGCIWVDVDVHCYLFVWLVLCEVNCGISEWEGGEKLNKMAKEVKTHCQKSVLVEC